jgi:pimeloyl-ACP methyl ester carboxylesterase
MTERIASVHGVDIAYETFGDPGDPPLLLVMGLAAQMVLWREEFCELLADRGFFVIRFDNRDVGRSSKTAGRPPRVWPALLGRRVRATYTLDDLADDAVGLLDELGIEAAHVVGASMGGMIAQAIAARHPDRVLTLTSIMSTTGDRRVGRARRRMLPILLSRPRPGRDRNVARAVRIFRAIGSPGFPFDEEGVRELAGRSYDRCFHPAGAAHQLAAILASGDRTAALRDIRSGRGSSTRSGPTPIAPATAGSGVIGSRRGAARAAHENPVHRGRPRAEPQQQDHEDQQGRRQGEADRLAEADPRDHDRPHHVAGHDQRGETGC